MMTLKAIKNNSVDRYGFVDMDKRADLLKRRYLAIDKPFINKGHCFDKTIKFHGVNTWSFSSPCHLQFASGGVIRLISYATDVADYYPTANGGVILKNGWYSMTTSNHIHEFCLTFGCVDNMVPDLAANAGVATQLDNLSVAGLDGVFNRIENAKNVFKYQRYQMAELLSDLFNDAVYYNHPEWSLNDSVLKIVKKLLNAMNADSKKQFTGGTLEPWVFSNNSRNIVKSWDTLKTILTTYAETLEKIAA